MLWGKVDPKVWRKKEMPTTVGSAKGSSRVWHSSKNSRTANIDSVLISVIIFFQGKEYHDQYTYENGFLSKSPEMDGSLVWTNLKLYNRNLNPHPLIQKRLVKLEERRRTLVPFTNLADEKTSKAQIEKLPSDMAYFFNHQEKELCRGRQNTVNLDCHISK